MRYILGRLVQSVVTVWGVVTVVFFILHLSGNPALLIAPQNATAAEIARIEVQIGMNHPLIVQYLLFLGRLLHGNFGYSYSLYEPAVRAVASRLPYTAALAGSALALTMAVGVPVGVVMAVFRGRLVDRALLPLVVAGQSMPAFWTGLLLILLFSVRLRWLPSSGAGTPEAILLPAVTLASISVAAVARVTRSSLLEELQKDYVRTAIAKGCSRTSAIVRHALRNALIPVLTITALQVANLLGGAVITETVFAWPGIGQLTVNALNALDIPVVETVAVLGSVVYVVVNFLTDVLYTVIDPAIKL